VGDPFEDLDLRRLRERRSAKWSRHPPDVLPAWVAEMDFPIAEPVRAALLAAVERDDCGYMSPAGLPAAFARFAAERYGWPVDPAAVSIVPDVMAGVAEVLRRATAPGDPVVINPPVYPPFRSVIQEVERTVAEVPLARDGPGWVLDLDRLERAFAAGARAYLLCNPHNPTGTVARPEELERIGELADRYGVVVLADEIHAPLVLTGARHTPFGGLRAPLVGRSVTLTSASKAWNVAGLKCAVAVAPEPPMRALIAGLPEEVRYRAGHLGVLAAIAAFEDGGEWLDGLLAHLDRQRHRLTDLLRRELPEVGYAPPQAGYLAWLDCRALPLGVDPAAAFLERGRVALSPGPDFGREGAGFARLNLGTSAALLAEAVRRMARAVSSEGAADAGSCP
jgi:cystathionine beta-lyase